MKRKQGISLIVLVITIIVMIILAASVVLTLSNSGIINKANEAVEKTNIKEVEQLASLAWAEEFMAGKRGDTLKEAVLEKLKDYTDKYTIKVTDTGVSVIAGNAKVLNEYGFYYDTPYLEQGDDADSVIVFKENGIVEWYYFDIDRGDNYIVVEDLWDEVRYQNKEIVLKNWMGEDSPLEVSDNGNTLTDPTSNYDVFKLSDLEYRDLYYGQKYYNYRDRNEYIIVNSDNTISHYYEGVLDGSIPGSSLTKTSHMLSFQTEAEWRVAMDGKTIEDNNWNKYVLVKENEIIIQGGCIGINVCKVDERMTWEQWINSSYNTLGIIIDDQGLVVPTCCSSHQNSATIWLDGQHALLDANVSDAVQYTVEYIPN